MVRKESARRWPHISARRCLDAIGIRVSNICFLTGILIYAHDKDRGSFLTLAVFFFMSVCAVVEALFFVISNSIS